MASENKEAKEAQRALHEHRVIQKLLQSVVQFISAQPRHTSEAIQTLLRDLKNLRGYMESHFEQEETAGLFEDILERLPMVDTVVKDLKREHRDFLEKVNGLIYRLELPEVRELEAIRTELNTFVSAFLEHEDIENDLLQRAYNLDLGSPG